MRYKIEHIGKALRHSREKKSLSQRALSEKVGLPQGHISNIENSTVDLKVSTLIELARALDLELMLVPRILRNTVEGLISQMHDTKDNAQAPPAYRLDEENGDGGD